MQFSVERESELPLRLESTFSIWSRMVIISSISCIIRNRLNLAGRMVLVRQIDERLEIGRLVTVQISEPLDSRFRSFFDFFE